MDEQTKRIVYYEGVFDELSTALRQVYDAVKTLERLRPLADELEAYYTGEQWKRDFEDDEAGRLPKTLKRGVLSEDGVNDLLDGVRGVYESADF